MIAPADNERISQLFKTPLGEGGFFLEDRTKLLPTDCIARGVFLAGLAQWPKSIVESIAQAEAASSQAAAILARDVLTGEGALARVDRTVCSGCRVCEVVCPYSAIVVAQTDKVAEVNEALCRGCGTCCAACPAGAVQQGGFTGQQVLSMIDAALEV